MIDCALIEKQLTRDLGLQHRPVAVAFRDVPPDGVTKFEGAQPSGCSFWRLASAGNSFYTVAADHYNCPIGAYTHNITLPAERANELTETLSFMTDIGYIRMEEVPGIPQLQKPPAVVVYAPLADMPVDPDVVLFWGPPGRVMLLQEAAIRAGAMSSLSTLTRPTCMVLPAAATSGVVASTGCIGNRVYTGLGEGDLYVAVPGSDLARIAKETATISVANATLLDYHRGRQSMATA